MKRKFFFILCVLLIAMPSFWGIYAQQTTGFENDILLLESIKISSSNQYGIGASSSFLDELYNRSVNYSNIMKIVANRYNINATNVYIFTPELKDQSAFYITYSNYLNNEAVLQSHNNQTNLRVNIIYKIVYEYDPKHSAEGFARYTTKVRYEVVVNRYSPENALITRNCNSYAGHGSEYYGGGMGMEVHELALNSAQNVCYAHLERLTPQTFYSTNRADYIPDYYNYIFADMGINYTYFDAAHVNGNVYKYIADIQNAVPDDYGDPITTNNIIFTIKQYNETFHVGIPLARKNIKPNPLHTRHYLILGFENCFSADASLGIYPTGTYDNNKYNTKYIYSLKSYSSIMGTIGLGLIQAYMSGFTIGIFIDANYKYWRAELYQNEPEFPASLKLNSSQFSADLKLELMYSFKLFKWLRVAAALPISYNYIFESKRYLNFSVGVTLRFFSTRTHIIGKSN